MRSKFCIKVRCDCDSVYTASRISTCVAKEVIMVRVIGPCLSGEARGKLGNILIFKKRLSTNVVGRYFRPRNPKSPGQIIVRNRTTKAVAGWKALTEGNQTLWNDYAKAFTRRGFNMYVSNFIIYMRDNAEAEPSSPSLPG